MSVWRSVRPGVWGALAFALLLLLLGLNGLGLRQERTRLSRLREQERSLRMLAERVETEQAWLSRQLPRKLDDPAVLLELYAEGARMGIRVQESEPLSETFRLRRVILEADGVAWEAMTRLLDAFELQSPPWRLQRIELRSGLNGLEGTLHFEGLEQEK